MNHGSAPRSLNTGVSGGSAGKRAFARHFGEMLLAMLLGMAVLGGLAELVVAVIGGSVSDQPGGFRVMLMGLSMTVPMVIWMSYRGHDGARNAEMAASMMVPTVAAAALAAASALGSGAALGVQHAVMVPAMLGVMLWRYEHYSQPHAWASPRRK
jgi:nitrate/nitrite transporter NarK